ncbi:hypothetical protein [Sphingopyxis sp. BSNA05]|nr:hypothetical protein [Sphingopyxis sp. BSNA05]
MEISGRDQGRHGPDRDAAVFGALYALLSSQPNSGAIRDGACCSI